MTSGPEANFESRVRASFARQQVMKSLGIEIVRIGPGEIELTMPYAHAYTQQHGFMHAGIIATALDSACGYAAFSLMPDDAGVLTVEYKINLLAPARGERFSFRSHVVKAGRTITVCEGKALALGLGGEKPVAAMICTLMAVVNRDDVHD